MLSRNLDVFPGYLLAAYITASSSMKEGRTRESPRARPSLHADKRLIFVITSRGSRGLAGRYFDST